MHSLVSEVTRLAQPWSYRPTTELPLAPGFGPSGVPGWSIFPLMARPSSKSRPNARSERNASDNRSTWNTRSADRDRLQLAGRLAGFMAHEVNNHLAAALLDLELALEASHPPATHDLLARLHVAVESAGEVCRGTLGLLRPDTEHTNAGVVGLAIGRAIACLGRLRSRVVVRMDPRVAMVAVSIPTGRLQQVVLNGVLNAVRETSAAVEVHVDVLDSTTVTSPSRQRSLANDTYSGVGVTVRVAIEDRGPGLPDHLAAQLEAPITKGRISQVGEGGLGLSVMKHVITSFGGTVRARRLKPRGTRLEFLIPVAGAPTQKRAA
jgi:two-component system, NtrC family, nitrogen regulation sensor histidine kinase GlnL